MGRKPEGERALSNAEKQKRYRERVKRNSVTLPLVNGIQDLANALFGRLPEESISELVKLLRVPKEVAPASLAHEQAQDELKWERWRGIWRANAGLGFYTLVYSVDIKLWKCAYLRTILR
jgi:hypothetical protein